MSWTNGVSQLLGERAALQLRLQETKSAISAYLFLALCYPLLMLGCAYGVQSLATEGAIKLPSIWVDAGIAVGWVGLIACPAIFLPRVRRNVREFREVMDELAKRGISIDQEKTSFRLDDRMKRTVLYSAIAVGIFVLGELVDGGAGMLLRWTGVAGVLVVGIALVFTNDVVLGGEDIDS